MTKLRYLTIPIPSESAAQWTALSAKSSSGREGEHLFAPEGLNRSEIVKNRTQKQCSANAAHANRCATPMGGPWQAKETNIVSLGNCFKGSKKIDFIGPLPSPN
jgi:hypothetical protein